MTPGHPPFLSCLAAVLVLAAAVEPGPIVQGRAERFWLAGRYDRTHFIVYFEAVQFKGTFPSDAAPIAPPRASGFFEPKRLTAAAMSRFQKGPQAERFRVGDRYDLLDGGRVVPMSLTSLVAFESDEQVGNESYVGAIGVVSRDDLPQLTKDYYAARRHVAGTEAAAPAAERFGAALLPTSVSRAVTSQIAALLAEWVKADRTAGKRGAGATPAVSIKRVQAITTSGGELRYFAEGESRSARACATVDAWLTPPPALDLLAADKVEYCPPYPGAGYRLRNAVELGGGRTGLIFYLIGGDGAALELVEYQEGIAPSRMRRWQTISFGE